MTAFFCDTDSELSFDTINELGINVIKMPYIYKGQEYLPEPNTDMTAFFAGMRAGEVPTTAALNAQNYIEYFEPYFKRGEDILYVAFGTPFSQTFNAMNIAVRELKDKYPSVRFECFDTKCISMATGLQVYIAAKLFNQGKSIDEILAVLKDLEPKAGAVIAVSDLVYLKRGGRVSSTAAAFGNMLQLKPILKIPAYGSLEPVKKVAGMKKALQTVLEDTIDNADTAYPIVIMHADDKAECDRLHAAIAASLPNADIWDYLIGPVIGAHCGPGTMAVCYIGKTPRQESKAHK